MAEYLLWQDLEPTTILLEDEPIFEKGALSRDEDFAITIILDGKLPVDYKPTRSDRLGGMLKNRNEFHARSERLGGHVQYRITKSFFNKESTSPNGEIHLFGLVSEVECLIEPESPREPLFAAYWFLNGSKEFAYPRSLSVESEGSTVVDFEGFATHNVQHKGPRSFGRSLVCLEYKEMRFVFGRVNKDLSKIDKCSFMRFADGQFPSSQDIFELQIALSWIIGVELVLVGSTFFDGKARIVKSTFSSPFRKDLHKAMDLPEMPILPVRINDYYSLGGNLENLINTLLAAFQDKRQAYNLVKTLWYINYSRSQSPTTMIQPLATAFDMLCAAYYRINPSRDILDRKAFLQLLKPIMGYLQEKAAQDGKYERILKNILNANRLTGNEKNSKIFKELELGVSEIETAALEERHAAVHGSPHEEDYPKRVVLSRVFYTLVGRVLLRLLDIKTDYIDYSMQGRSVNKLEIPQQATMDMINTQVVPL